MRDEIIYQILFLTKKFAKKSWKLQNEFIKT